MADFVYNIGLGRTVQCALNVEANVPTGCALLVVAIDRASATDDTMKNYDNLSLLLADANVDEVTNAGYARKVLVAADLPTPAPTDASDRWDIDIPDQTWTGVAAGDPWTDLVACYRPATASADTDIIPLTNHTFAITPDGSDITAVINAAGFFRAA